MFYQNDAVTKNFVVRNNIFVNSSEVITRMGNDWRSGLHMHNNLLYQEKNPIMRWLGGNYYSKDEFTEYRQELKLDQESMFAKPEFVNPVEGDQTLIKGSPGTHLATDGGCVGMQRKKQHTMNTTRRGFTGRAAAALPSLHRDYVNFVPAPEQVAD